MRVFIRGIGLLLITISATAQPEFIEELDNINKMSSEQPMKAIQLLNEFKKKYTIVPSRDTIKIMQVEAFCNYYLGNTNSAIEIFKNALRQSKRINDSTFIGKMWNNLGITYFKIGESETALAYYDSSLLIKKRMHDTLQIATTYLNIANVYNYKGFYISAITHYYQSLKVFESLNKSLEAATTLVNIGTCQQALKQYNDAEKNFKKSLLIFETLNHQEGILTAMNNIATIKMDNNEPDEALSIFYEIIRRAVIAEDSLSMAYAYSNLGKLYTETNEWKSAYRYFNQATSIFTRYGYTNDILENKAYEAVSSYCFSPSVYNLGKSDSIFEHLLQKKDYLTALKMGAKYVSCLKKNKDYIRATKIYEKLFDTQNQIYSERNITLTKDMEEKYEADKKEKELIVKQKELNHLKYEKKLQDSKFKLILISIISILLFLAILISFLVYKNKQKNKLLKQLEISKRTELQYQELQNKSLQTQLQNKNQELTKMAMYISEKRNFLQSIYKELKKIRDVSEIKQVYLRIMQSVSSSTENEDFYQEVNQFLATFSDTLKINYPQLTDKDIRLCSLIQLGLKSKDIASIFNISPKSVEMQRYRLRKKINIDSDISIDEWLNHFYSKLHNID